MRTSRLLIAVLAPAAAYGYVSCSTAPQVDHRPSGLMTVVGPGSGSDVLTQHNDRNRSGVYPSETLLTPTALTNDSFGELWRLPVDGAISGQPLYVANYTTAGQSQPK